MANESECSKKFKKIADRYMASTKKQTRIVKEYRKLWTNYSTINELLGESTKNLNSANLIARQKSQMIDALKQIQEEREQELNKVREDIEVLQNKIIDLLSENNKTPIEKFKMNILKICTKTHISDKVPHVIRGFTAKTDNSEVIPFEIVPGPKTKNEIEDTLWENTFRGSEHGKQWKHLFNSSLE